MRTILDAMVRWAIVRVAMMAAALLQRAVHRRKFLAP